MTLRILVAEDEAVLRGNVVRFLAREGHAAEGVDSAEAALERLAAQPFDLVLTDLRMPGLSGLDLLRRIREGHPETFVVVMTAFASVDAAVEALRLGAQDFLLKPISLGELGHRVARLAEHRELELRVQRLREQLGAAEPPPDDFVAVAPATVELVRLIDRLAGARSTVLIQGESGTGKELVARALHDRAPWRDRPFVPVHLAAVPRELVDATLFGHERGAFTGAAGRREGVFRAAEGGTVFLDEVGELPPEVQVKLLRVLEAREVQPLGSDRPVPVDVRLVAATNRPLKAMVEAGTFRADLYYRLDVVRLDVPPLRDRPEDVVPLAERLLARHARRLGRPVPRLAAETAAALRAYRWPGNVRELSNVLERALLLSDGERLLPADLPADLRDGGGEVLLLREAVAAFEARHVRRVLELAGGDKAKAAEMLGVHLATLYRHLDREG